MHPPLFNSRPHWGHLLELYLEDIFSLRPSSVGKKPKTNHYYELLSIAHSRLLARPAPTLIKRDTLGLQRECRRYEPLPKRGRARGKWHALTYAEIMLSVLKGFGFPLPHQRSGNKVMTTGVRYVSAITRTHLRKAPCVPSQIVPVRLLLLSA